MRRALRGPQLSPFPRALLAGRFTPEGMSAQLQLGEPVPRAGKPSVISNPKLIDSAVHVWSDGEAPFPWEGAPPPEPLRSAATHEALAQLLRGAAGAAGAAGVAGALIVQPSVHKFDHSYVTAALRAHPELYRGMWRSSSSTRAL